ncbi:MAG: hypothetical protein U0835_20810 [Isosphaeraceae bacterium]
MKKSPAVVAAISSLALGGVGLACLVVSARVFETIDGFYVTFASRTFELPDNGMLGDYGTYSTEWAVLGLFCLVGAVMVVIALLARDRLLRGIAWAGLALSLAAAAVLAHNVVL